MKIWICLLLTLTIPLWGFQSPLSTYTVSSEVGYRPNPMGGGEDALHRGIDMVGPYHSPILAAEKGVVVEHWLPPGTVRGGRIYKGHPIFGGLIVIDHGGGVLTLYGHLSSTYIHEGDIVEAGQVIGRQGDTGLATGEHLHFEIIIDPRNLFDLFEKDPTPILTPTGPRKE